MRRILTCLALAVLVPAPLQAQLQAQAPGSTLPDPADTVTRDYLIALDEFRIHLPQYKDNQFVYEQKKREYLQAAAGMQGKPIAGQAVVRSVSEEGVSLRPPQFRRTRVVLKYYDEHGNGVYGNDNYRVFPGPPGNERLAKHMFPPILRIGGEVDAGLARQLRKDDILLLKGTIESVETRIVTGNTPDTLIFVTDISVERAALLPQRYGGLQPARRLALAKPGVAGE